MSKKISFSEFQPLWVEYSVEVEISDNDYESLENKEIELSDIVDKYEVEYIETRITGYCVDTAETEYESYELKTDSDK